MNIAYDCVAFWVGKAGRKHLLEIFKEDYGATVTASCERAEALFYYKDKPTMLFHASEYDDIGELVEYMEEKVLSGKISTYIVIDYPKLVKELREEWTYEYH